MKVLGRDEVLSERVAGAGSVSSLPLAVLLEAQRDGTAWPRELR